MTEKLKAKLCGAAAIVGAVLLFIGFVALSVGFVAYNKAFYNREFEKYAVMDEADLTQEGLDAVRDKIVAYFSGRDKSLQTIVTFAGESAPREFYTETELSHMADVLAVFAAVRIVAAVFLPVGLALIAAAVLLTPKRPRLAAAARGCAVGMVIILAILGATGIFVAADFNTAFTVFHGIFFPQGNWQFPYDSKMLAVLPEGLFFDAGIAIILWGLGFCIAVGCAGIIYGRVIKKRVKAEKQ